MINVTSCQDPVLLHLGSFCFGFFHFFAFFLVTFSLGEKNNHLFITLFWRVVGFNLFFYNLGEAYRVDVTDYDQVQTATDHVVYDFNGRLDIFVANAGVFPDEGAILDHDIDNYRNIITTNLDGVFYCARAAAIHWRRQKSEDVDANGGPLEGFTYGKFVTTASISGWIVDHPELQAAYSLSKAGVIQLCILPPPGFMMLRHSMMAWCLLTRHR